MAGEDVKVKSGASIAGPLAGVREVEEPIKDYALLSMSSPKVSKRFAELIGAPLYIRRCSSVRLTQSGHPGLIERSGFASEFAQGIVYNGALPSL
jgi:hypothetical protein